MKDIFETTVIKGWQSAMPKWFHRSVSGKIIFPYRKAYTRVVKKFQNAQFETVIEWGDIFDVIRES